MKKEFEIERVCYFPTFTTFEIKDKNFNTVRVVDKMGKLIMVLKCSRKVKKFKHSEDFKSLQEICEDEGVEFID